MKKIGLFLLLGVSLSWLVSACQGRQQEVQKEHPDNLKVVTWEGKGFNYSALNNFGEKFATGEYLLLLNNDTEVITAAWLEEMVMYAQQKRVGCVGAAFEHYAQWKTVVGPDGGAAWPRRCCWARRCCVSWCQSA
jgi:hypothetical protein